ncbi:MAG: ATP-binding protein [Chlamydiales bacterium]|nr:ATP-binding protein [Chlamydiales bacterium]
MTELSLFDNLRISDFLFNGVPVQRKMMGRLLKWKKEPNRKPLLLKGVRQVGKTHLLKEFGRLHFSQFHYFNFEKEPGLAKIFEPDLIPERILRDLSFHLNRSINVGEDLVIFDEIQELPKALTSLKYFQEDSPELHLCGAGSLLGLHLNQGSFPVGKVTFETLRPLSFEEFLMANHDKALPLIQTITSKSKLSEIVHEHLWDQLKRYFIVGGLPEAVATYCANQDNLFEAFSRVRKKQEDLLNTYYADIAKHSGKVNAMHIDRVFRSVPAQLQQVQDGSSARFKFKGVVPGITHYDRLAGAIDWLEATGLIIKVHIVNTGHLPFKGYAKENFFKLLAFDVGILGSMSDLSPKLILDYDYGSYKGYFAENFIAQELLASGRDHLFSWQENQAEIEFLVEIDGKAIPIEVKSGSSTKAKSLKVFSEKYTPPYQVIFSGKPLNNTHGMGIHYYPLYLAGCFPIA